MGKSKFKVGDKVRLKGRTKIYTIGYVKYDAGDRRSVYTLKEWPSTYFVYSYQLEKVDSFMPKSNIGTANSTVTLEFDKTTLNTIDSANKFKNCANKTTVDGVVIKNRYGDVDENTRAVKLTLEEAQEMYSAGGKLREFALRVFTEDELHTVPCTWEEYCENAYGKFYYINSGRINDYTIAPNIGGLDTVAGADLFPSYELTKSVLAFEKLLILRNAWIKNWTPDWSDEKQEKYYLKWCFKNVSVFPHTYTDGANEVMSFPTIEMARKFKNCFGDFLETAKNLY